MQEICFTSAGSSPALAEAEIHLREHFSFTSHLDNRVTHLLLPVPSFTEDGQLQGGGSIREVLKKLPDDVILVGGQLRRPEITTYRKIDLLEDPGYLAENAGITAYCALKHAVNTLPVTLNGCPVLILGWGRIGKALSRLLAQLGAKVTVFARKEQDRGLCRMLGYHTQVRPDPSGFRVIFNTVPAMILPEAPATCIKIDLASKSGLGGEGVLRARGLPGKDAPESSGQLIARTVCRLIAERKDLT